MVTCLGDLFYPEVGVRIVRLLRRLGVSVDFPAGQTCCGLPLFNSGYHDEAAAVWHEGHAEPGRGAAVHVITGPSRTADIELTLTRGVHGPKEVHAIFVEGPNHG